MAAKLTRIEIGGLAVYLPGWIQVDLASALTEPFPRPEFSLISDIDGRLQ